MSTSQTGRSILRDYLLGFVTGKSREELEFELTSNEKYFREMFKAEDELVDDYVFNRLSHYEEEAFESHFLCLPERRQKLSFGRALGNYVGSSAQTEQLVAEEKPKTDLRSWLKGFFWVPAPGFAVLLILIVLTPGLWITSQIREIQEEMDSTQIVLTALSGKNQELIGQLEEGRQSAAHLTDNLNGVIGQLNAIETALTSLPSAAVKAILPTFILRPGSERSAGETNRISISKASQLVEIKLEIGIDEYPSYLVELHDSSTDIIWTRKKLSGESDSETAFVSFTVAAEVLGPGEYYFVLRGETPDDFERFDSFGFSVSQD